MKINKTLLGVLGISILIIGFFLIILFNTNGSLTNFQTQPKVIYFVDHISIAHQKLIEKFNEKYKNKIKVEVINVPFEKFSTNERKELLARYLRSKSDRIDVFSVDQIWMPRFTKWSLPLNTYFDEKQLNNLINEGLQTCYYNDTLYAIPLYLDISVLYYREDLLKHLPDYQQIKKKLQQSITWEDFLGLHKRLKTKNPFFIFQAEDYEGLICIFSEILASLNSSFVKGGSLSINTPESKKALQFLLDLVHKYKVSPNEVVRLKENPSYEYFIKNNGIFLRGWPSFLIDTNVFYYNSEIYSNLKRVPTPHFANHKRASVFGGWNLIVSKYSKNIDEAITFISFLISEEAQKIFYEEGGYLPVNSKFYRDSNFINKNEDLKFYYDLFQYGFHRPSLDNYTNIADVLSHYLNLAIQEKISIDEALKLSEEVINTKSILLK